MDDDVESIGYCLVHKTDIYCQDCPNCGGERFSHHDCGEDCCFCLDPVDNVICDWCNGEGSSIRCSAEPKHTACSRKDWRFDSD